MRNDRERIMQLLLFSPLVISCLTGFTSAFAFTNNIYSKNKRASPSPSVQCLASATPSCRRRSQHPLFATAAQFEYQEMKIQLDAMNKAGVASRDLEPTKRAELEGYIRQVVNNRPSNPPVWTDATFYTKLPGTDWRLAFSTEAAALGDLPRDATVHLKFNEGSDTMDYTLEFSGKTLGLESIKAKSKWFVDCDNKPGLVTFVYDKITTDLFGLKDIGIGFFGLLQGRANFVETAFFDNEYWIERALAVDGQKDYLNVYVREDNDAEW
jgi:hypothetical protein